MSRNNKTLTNKPFYQKIALVIFGLFLTIVILETGLRLGGFVLLSIQEYKNRVSVSQRGSYRIMCLGESTTAGEYPPFLEEILNQRNSSIKFSVIDKGVPGINTGTIVARLESNLDEYHPDMVITMMGINDFGAHMPYEAISDSKTINFLRSFRTYKLARLLWLNIATRLKGSKQLKLPLQGIELQQVDKEGESALPSDILLKYKKAIELNPESEEAYLQLGNYYVAELENDYLDRKIAELYKNEAVKLYKKALELNPESEEAYFGLGNFYEAQHKFFEAAERYKKVLELNPESEGTYLRLGNYYVDELENDYLDGKIAELYKNEAVKLYKKAIELNPENEEAYFELGNFYRFQNEFSAAAKVYKRYAELNPEDDRVYRRLEVLYKEMDNPELAREYGKKVRELSVGHYNPMTVGNYHKLKAILEKRGIAYICVQYPMRNLERLKKIFQGNTDGIIFVDNEKLFKNALKKASYREYFVDTFGGDFGHCTRKGNRLLAENIADAVVKEVFKK